MSPSFSELTSTLCFAFALIHSLSAGSISEWAKRQKTNAAFKFLHSTAEVEIIFVLYAFLFLLINFVSEGRSLFFSKLSSHHFSEAIFITVIMLVASSSQILSLARRALELIASLLPFSLSVSTYLTLLILAPLLGSLITEPAAMTLGALLLREKIFTKPASSPFFYSTLAVLFINVSIGGILTSFSAPPVLMVAKAWDWNTLFMLGHFGWKSVLICGLNAGLVTRLNLRALSAELPPPASLRKERSFLALLSMLIILALTIFFSHHALMLVIIFAAFLAVLKLNRVRFSLHFFHSPFLVGAFLASLIILTSEQSWWVKPILTSLSPGLLYLSAIFLTAITDNAALTSLASTVPNLDFSTQIALLGGAVAGGGLTLIANAPNPAGYALLKNCLHPGGFSPVQLLRYALPFTALTGTLLWIL